MNNGDEPLTFEKALLELERIVRDLEEGRSGLEESLAQYELGVSLLKQCYEQLRQAEQRIALLTGMDGEGNPITRPFAHAASADKPAGGEKLAAAKPVVAANNKPAAQRAPVAVEPKEEIAAPARPPAREPARAPTEQEPPAKPRPPGGFLWE